MNNEKHIYEFSLILGGNVDDTTPDLEDSLYQAGCDDALINFRSGTVCLDFDRKATSFVQAVLKAIEDVESSPVGAIVVGVTPDTLMSEPDILKRLNIKEERLMTNEENEVSEYEYGDLLERKRYVISHSDLDKLLCEVRNNSRDKYGKPIYVNIMGYFKELEKDYDDYVESSIENDMEESIGILNEWGVRKGY